MGESRKAEDADGLTPDKDDNAAGWKIDRKDGTVFKWLDYISKTPFTFLHSHFALLKTGGSLMLLTLAYRTVVMFAVILIAMRILGKRQLGQLELNELVVAVMLSEFAVAPITNPTNRLLYGIIPIAVLATGELLLAYICMKSVRLRAFFIGKPSTLIQNGQINQREMRKNRITLTELTEKLRAQGHTDLSTIKYVLLEVNGALSILPFTAHAPATHNAHQLPGEDKGLPVLIINDGRVLDENLKSLGLDGRWLEKELQKRGVSGAKDVFFFTVDEKRNVYFAAKEHNH